MLPLGVLALASCNAIVGRGISTVTIENDWFIAKDNNYTNGFGVSWISCALSDEDEDSVPGTIVEAVDFLPGVGDPDHASHVGFQLSQSMFTPANITLPDPPLDDRPYAGVLALDTSVFTHDDGHLHTWSLKLGVVGPSSLADGTQDFFHDLVGDDDPKGWAHQLHDEPLLNVAYTYGWRLWRGGVLGLEYDVTPNAGGAVGNYATFANAGVSFRLGHGLPDSFGSHSLRAGTQSNAVVLSPLEDDWGWNLFAGVQGFAVERFLPQDGNTWESSRGVETEELIGGVTAGLALNLKGLLATFTISRATDTYENEVNNFEYGSLSLTWIAQ